MKSQAYAKAKDPTQEFYANQKKILEINPRHPVVKELLKRVQADKEDKTAVSTANLIFETATLRSGYALKDSVGFAERIEGMLRSSLNLSPEEMVEEEEEFNEEGEEEKKDEAEEKEEKEVEGDEDEIIDHTRKNKVEESHSELWEKTTSH